MIKSSAPKEEPKPKQNKVAP